MFAWSVGIIVAGLAGQIFWIFESFGNWFLIELCVWCLLVNPGVLKLPRIYSDGRGRWMLAQGELSNRGNTIS
jgi:hypothetical protein